MNNIQNITSAIQKKNKSLKSKIDKNLPKMSSAIFSGMLLHFGPFDWYYWI